MYVKRKINALLPLGEMEFVWNVQGSRASDETIACCRQPVMTWSLDEWKTYLMSLAILFRLLCAQHVSDINISIFRSLRLCCWVTTSVVLFSVRCVLEIWCGNKSSSTQRTENKTTDVVTQQHSRKLLKMDILMSETCWAHKISLQNEHHPKPAAPNLQHTTNWQQDDRCGNSTTQSQAPEDGYINVRNMLST